MKKKKETALKCPFPTILYSENIYAHGVDKSMKIPIIFYQKHSELSTEKCAKAMKQAKIMPMQKPLIHS